MEGPAALDYALQETDEPPDNRGRGKGEPLSGRELEIAKMVAEGLTNSEIAHRLVVSPRTVDAHVEHIRNKLGLRSRAQIAVWVIGGTP